MKIDDNNFDVEVLTADLPVLVEFGAEWCGPCVRQMEVLKTFAKNFENKVKVLSVDIDESPKSTSKYGIRSVPTLILFVNGNPFHTKVGLNSLVALEQMVSSVLENK